MKHTTMAERATRKPVFLLAFLMGLLGALFMAEAADSSLRLPKKGATDYLAKVQDQHHSLLYVYNDFISAGNHFIERGQMCNPGDEPSVPSMNENWKKKPYAGSSCIRCEFKARKSNWGGWFFMNGAFLPKDSCATLNWGETPGAGVNLQGATKLTFWARGEKGGEKVKFFCFGLGRDSFSGKARKPHPDSAPQAATGYVRLNKDWTQYTLDVKDLNLTNVLLGFAWQTKAGVNEGKDIVFYLDEIAYDKPRLNEPRLMVSYETIPSDDDVDLVLRNTAYTYDNALAALAFLGAGDVRRARLIADALVYAQKNDRHYTDGRLRNAYQGGDLALPPGWAPGGRTRTARIPGWWDSHKRSWLEDRVATGSYAGNMAWAMLALISCYEVTGCEDYLASAERMGDWIEKHCRDQRGAGGYTAGYEGWEPNPDKLCYKSTEHNIDLFAVFQRLHLITGEPCWQERARHAQRFVTALWDSEDGKFWTGTGDDGITIYKEVIPIDAQTWALMAFRNRNQPLSRGLEFAEAHLRSGRGFDFNQDADGVWFEGTAQMAAAYAFTGQDGKREEILDFLQTAQSPCGALPSADREVITTGFHLKDGDAWLYYKRLHVGATAWMALAERSLNPFWMASDLDDSLAMLNLKSSHR